MSQERLNDVALFTRTYFFVGVYTPPRIVLSVPIFRFAAPPMDRERTEIRRVSNFESFVSATVNFVLDSLVNF